MNPDLSNSHNIDFTVSAVQHLSGYDLYFALARGVPGTEALDMSKFFDTNYHYLVPELATTVTPKPDFSLLYDKVRVCANPPFACHPLSSAGSLHMLQLLLPADPYVSMSLSVRVACAQYWGCPKLYKGRYAEVLRACARR